MKIVNAVGAVRVTGWDRDSVAITGRLGAGAERLEFSSDERETKIRVVLQRDARDVAGTELEVRVPRYSHVAVRTSAAPIEVSGVSGGLDLESVSGRIRASGSPRTVYAESAAGDLELEVSTKAARARSVQGDVTLRGARGFLEVSTVSGAAHVTGTDIWEGEITSVSGDINFESHSGTIDLTLPATIRADFELTTFAGASVENEFAPDSQRSFSLGGGGTRVRIKSFKGRVRISGR